MDKDEEQKEGRASDGDSSTLKLSTIKMKQQVCGHDMGKGTRRYMSCSTIMLLDGGLYSFGMAAVSRNACMQTDAD